MNRRAVTLVEILVAFFILALISTSLYFILSESSYRRAKTAARDAAKNEITKVLKILDNDLQQARYGSFEEVTDQVIRIKVRREDKPDKDEKLEYHYTRPFLRRKLGNKEWLISSNLSSFRISSVYESPGQLLADIETSFAFDGLRPEDAQSQSMTQVIIMREDASRENDPHWRDVGSVSHFFQTQGSLLAGVREDANRLFEDIAGEFSSLTDDLRDMTVGQLEQAKLKLKDSLNNIGSKLDEVDDRVAGLNGDGVFKINHGGFLGTGIGSNKKKLNKKADKIKTALNNMKNKNDMDWGAIIRIAGKDAGKMRSTTRELFNAKSDMFNAGQEIIKNMQSLNMSTDDINMRRWGL